EEVGDLAVLEDVALHVDRFFGTTDGVDHGGIERGAVGQNVDLVVPVHRGIARRFEDVNEMVTAGIDGRFHTIGNVRREEDGQDQPGDEDAADDREVLHLRG